jgi:hypothetical protein
MPEPAAADVERWAPSLAIVSAKLEQSESVHRKEGSYEASAS